MKDFDTFRSGWTGRSVDYDHTFKCQCVDLIQQGEFEMHNLTGLSGNAIDYWKAPSANLLKTHDRLPTTEVTKGDIVILRTYGRTDLEGDGHIGYATGAIDAVNFELFEQNGYGGGDGLSYPDGRHRNEIGTRWIPRSRIAGVYRKKSIPLPPPYTAEPFTRKLMTIRDTYLYDCNRRDFTDRHSNPIKGVSKSYSFDCQAVYTTADGSRYYVEDTGNSGGYYVPDVDNYVAPVVVPVTPPAAPIEVKKAEMYDLKNTVMYFKDYKDANNHRNAISTIDPRSYFVYEKVGEALHLSRDNMKDDKYWINISDDVPPQPKPEPLPPKITETIQNASDLIPPPPQDFSWMKMTYLRADKKPVNYVCTSIQSIPVYDFITKQKLGDLNQHKVLSGKNAIVGTFQKQAKDGRVEVFARRVVDVQYDLWPTIPADYLIPEIDDDDADFAYMEKMTGWFDINSQYLRKALKNTKTFIDGIIGRER